MKESDISGRVLSPVELEMLADEIAVRVADRLAARRRLLTRDELAVAINLSVPTIDRMLREGQLPAIRVRRKVLFDLPAVLRHLSARSANE